MAETVAMKAAHTAEHLLMASLKRIRPNAKVMKVDHRGLETSVFVHCEDLSWDDLLRAQLLANDAIEQGRPVTEHYFDDLAQARARYPNLRAIEERISGKVRVIEIDGYDFAACNRDHVVNTKECDFLLVSRLSRTGEQFQVDLLVGHEARVRALELSATAMKCCSLLGTDAKTLERASQNLLRERDSLKAHLRRYARDRLNHPAVEAFGDVQVYTASVEGADMKLLNEAASHIISQPNRVAILTSSNGDTTVVLACSENVRLESNAILSETMSRFGGKGGGKPRFASGSLPSGFSQQFLEQLSAKIKSILAAQPA